MQIVLENAGYSYQREKGQPVWALQGVNLAIAKGSFVGIIGHSGSGKSTLAMLTAGLYLPTQGQVLLNGKAAPKSGVFPQVGVVFQYPEQQLFGETVFEEVAFAPRNFGVPEAKLTAAVHKALEAVNLDPAAFQDRSPFSLSGGEKRRVAIASILAAGAEVLIFDEPTAGVDEKGRQWIITLARRENAKGKTILWISHNMDEVAEVAQQLLVLNQGRLAAAGAPAEVFAQEELLDHLGLGLPQAARLVRRLRQGGQKLPGRALTADEAFGEIHYLLGGGPTA